MRDRGTTALMLAAVLSACTPAGPLPSPREAAIQPVAGGRVVVRLIADVVTMTSWLGNDTSSTDLSGIVYQSLLGVDPRTGAPAPRLAEAFSQSADGRTLTFRLRPGLRWSDGSELSGEDFRFTVEAILRSGRTVRRSSVQDIVGSMDFRQGRSRTIEGIQIDARTIMVRLTRPFCPALSAVGGLLVVPRSVFGKYHDATDATRNVDKAPENDNPPLASGPFKLVERVKGQRIVLERNDLFYGGRPLLDAIEFRVLAGTAAAAPGEPDPGRITPARTSFEETKDALLAGTVDVASFVALDRPERDDFRRAPNLELRSFRGSRYTYIGWNQLRGGKEFFRSKAVRQALAYGLDVDAVLDKVLGGEALKMLSHTHPLSWAYDPAGLREYRYDPRRAQQLLEQDGWSRGTDGIYQKAGQRLAFTLTSPAEQGADWHALQREAVQQYGQIGIAVTPELVEFAELVRRLLRKDDPRYGVEGGRDLDAFIVRWVLGPDPDAYNIFHSSQILSGSNNVGYRSPVADRALEDGRTKCTLEERKAAQRVLDRELNEDQPYLFALAPNSYLVSSRKLQGLDPTPFGGHLWNVEKWWVRP